MRLGRRILKMVYAASVMPRQNELRGTYKVEMLWGIIPNLSRLGHIKIFKEGSFFGYNVTSGRQWGHFWFMRTPRNRALEINYNIYWRNNFITRRIRDRVRRFQNSDDRYIGEFRYVFWRKPRLLGYFRLTKEAANER